MHTDESFSALFEAIKALGYSDEVAGDYAVQIGDIPVTDDEGHTLIFDKAGNVVDRLKLEYFGSWPPKKRRVDRRARKEPPFRLPQSNEEFEALIAKIMALGHDYTSASRFARIICTTPRLDAEGNTLVMERETVIATLKLKH